MPIEFIPFNSPSLTGRELEYIQDAVASRHLSGDGQFTKRCSSLLVKLIDSKRSLLTTSCTHALEIAALLLRLQPGDEVIVPSFTFVSTANAFVLHGGRPVFVDVRTDTLNLDEKLLERAITPRTRAVVPVHYAGVGCEMDSIMEVCNRRNVLVVEDNAHGFLGKYRGRPLGSFGSLSTLSFHETKNITCGEGGALLINTAAFLERAEIIREKGTNRGRFFRGEVDKYSWVDIGSSYLPSEVLAAFLWSQLEVRNSIQKRRRAIWERYYEELKGWAPSRGVQLPVVPSHCDQAFHMFYILLPTPNARTEAIARLKEASINAVFHYLPLHISDVGRRLGGEPGDCPVTEDVAERLLRLPFFTAMTEDQQSRVIDVIRQVL